jgi:hypothetical protein
MTCRTRPAGCPNHHSPDKPQCTSTREKPPDTRTGNGSGEDGHPAKTQNIPAPARHGRRPRDVQMTDGPMDGRQEHRRCDHRGNAGPAQTRDRGHLQQ